MHTCFLDSRLRRAGTECLLSRRVVALDFTVGIARDIGNSNCALITQLAVNREQIIFPVNFIVDRQKPGSDISGNAGQLIW